jgi:hypothetical protein
VPRGYRKDGSKLTPDPVQTKYSESYVARVFELCLLGLKDKQIGELLGVSETCQRPMQVLRVRRVAAKARVVGGDEDLDEILTWREERTVTRNLTLHYDRMMLLLDPTPLARDLVRKAAGPDKRPAAP